MTSGDFRYRWVGDELHAVNEAVGGNYVTGTSDVLREVHAQASFTPDHFRPTSQKADIARHIDRVSWPVCLLVPGCVNLCFRAGRLAEGSDPNNREFVLTRELNYHPDGGQVFFPTSCDPFVMILAPPGDDIQLSDFRAFYCDGSCGLQIKVFNLRFFFVGTYM